MEHVRDRYQITLYSLTQEDIDAVSVNSFKNKLEKKRTCQMDFFKDKYSLQVLPAA